MTPRFAVDSGAARCGPVPDVPATAPGRSRFSGNSRRSSPPALCHFCEILPTSFPSCHCPYIPAHSKNVCTTETRRKQTRINDNRFTTKATKDHEGECRIGFYFVTLLGLCRGSS